MQRVRCDLACNPKNLLEKDIHNFGVLISFELALIGKNGLEVFFERFLWNEIIFLYTELYRILRHTKSAESYKVPFSVLVYIRLNLKLNKKAHSCSSKFGVFCCFICFCLQT